MKRPGTVAICATLLAALAATTPQPTRAQGNAQAVNQTVEKIPNPAPDLRAQAQAALAKQDYKSAIDLLTKYVAEAPKDPIGHFQLGYAYTALKQWTQAADEYKQAIALDPKLAPAQMNLGLVLLRSDPAAAVEPLSQAAALSPNEVRPQLLLAMALERSGQPAEAAAAYRAAVKIDPKNFDSHYELARILLSLKQPADAETEFRLALGLQPKSPDALAGLSESLLEQNKTEAGTKELEAYLAVRPSDASARVRLAGILATAGHLDDAMAQLAQVPDQGPEAPAAWRLRGEILLAQKNYAAAIDPLQKAAAALPNDADLHADLGQALLNEKKYEAAAKDLTRAVTLDPKRVRAWRDLVAARDLTGQWAATLDALAHLEQLEPLVPISLFVRASCYDHLGNLPEAIAAYQKFLAVDGGKLQTEEYQARHRLPVLEDLLRHQKKK
ncbi:MAG: tetratricopeptide repeat protein [Acidobacteriota bacterium]|nr:tetratricopeptide repeat protein [Acidobacteriota bacterium]